MSYIELLAKEDFLARQEYDENAKDLLVEHNEYEVDIPAEDHHPDELEDQEEFQKFHGSRQIVEVPKEPPKYDDRTTQSVKYNKDFATRVISVDSRFRANQGDSTTNFLFKLLVPIKNVCSVRLSSIELPNTFYNFSVVKGNTTFLLYYPQSNPTPHVINIGNNYKDEAVFNGVNYSDPDSLAQDVETQMQLVDGGFTVLYNKNSGKITIRHATNIFKIDFSGGPFGNRLYDWGLGYNLGYRQKQYSGSTFYTGEAIIDLLGPNYMLVSLNPDWKCVYHNQPDKNQFRPFAKIIVDEPKNAIIYDNGANTVTKEYWLDQPITVSSFQIIVTDPYEETIDLLGASVSLTVELKEIMNPSAYEHIRSLVN